jgi:hypothetical protein
MNKNTTNDMDDELRPEYDLAELLKGGVRGKYVERYRAGTNLVRLEPDVARAFPDEAAVNEALRLVIRLGEIQRGKQRARASS